MWAWGLCADAPFFQQQHWWFGLNSKIATRSRGLSSKASRHSIFCKDNNGISIFIQTHGSHMTSYFTRIVQSIVIKRIRILFYSCWPFYFPCTRVGRGPNICQLIIHDMLQFVCWLWPLRWWVARCCKYGLGDVRGCCGLFIWWLVFKGG